jgi:hypothetical protein
VYRLFSSKRFQNFQKYQVSKRFFHLFFKKVTGLKKLKKQMHLSTRPSFFFASQPQKNLNRKIRNFLTKKSNKTRYFEQKISEIFEQKSFEQLVTDAGNLADAADGAVSADEAVGAAADHAHRRLLGANAAASVLHGHPQCRPGDQGSML